MPLFKDDPQKLAEFLTTNPWAYNAGADFFNVLKGRGILSSGLEESLSKDLEIFKAAHDIATNAAWFAFEVYDSWAERTDQIHTGVELYQKANSVLVRRLGLGSNGAPRIDTALRVLGESQVKKIYTLGPPLRGYCGVKPYHRDIDKDYVERKILEPSSVERFKLAGIDVEILKAI